MAFLNFRGIKRRFNDRGAGMPGLKGIEGNGRRGLMVLGGGEPGPATRREPRPPPRNLARKPGAALGGETVFLQAAGGFVREGADDETGGEGGL